MSPVVGDRVMCPCDNGMCLAEGRIAVVTEACITVAWILDSTGEPCFTLSHQALRDFRPGGTTQ